MMGDRWGASFSSCRYETSFIADRYSRNTVILDFIGQGKHVLELGCSTGYLSRELAKAGCNVTGIEVDRAAAQIAQAFCEQVIVEDLNGDAWLERLAGRTFGVVLIGDVLEHLADPLRVLLQVRKLLGRDGAVIISLPNVVHWITRVKMCLGHFDYQDTGTLDVTHLRFFTLKTAEQLITQGGYQIARFHPAVGGRLSGHGRFVWQWLALRLPGLFAFQFVFEAHATRTEVEW